MRHQNDLETQKKAREKSVSVPIMTFFSWHKCLKLQNNESRIVFVLFKYWEHCYNMSFIQNMSSRKSQNVQSGEGDVKKKRCSFMLL